MEFVNYFNETSGVRYSRMMECLLTSSFQALVVGELWKEEKWVYSILLVCQLATFVQDTVAMARSALPKVRVLVF